MVGVLIGEDATAVGRDLISSHPFGLTLNRQAIFCLDDDVHGRLPFFVYGKFRTSTVEMPNWATEGRTRSVTCIIALGSKWAIHHGATYRIAASG
jgi:hypothetical protein